MDADELTLDGNAVAGLLGELFACDVTLAAGTCAACGSTAVLAETRVYARGPGTVMRCRSCDAVLLALVERPDGLAVTFDRLRRVEVVARAAG